MSEHIEIVRDGVLSTSIEIARSTQGVAPTCKIHYPARPDQTHEDAVTYAARLAGLAYAAGLVELEQLGLVPGREPKPEGAR